MPELIAHVLTKGGADADATADDLREYLAALPRPARSTSRSSDRASGSPRSSRSCRSRRARWT